MSPSLNYAFSIFETSWRHREGLWLYDQAHPPWSMRAGIRAVQSA